MYNEKHIIGESGVNMDLRQIRYFLTVAEEKSISRAAQKLHISQPPLSRQIRALEEQIGVPLFFRSSSGLTLTKAGHQLRERGEALIHLYDTTLAEMQTLAAQEKSRIVFGSIDGSSLLVEPVYVKLFKKSFINAKAESYVGTAEEITDRMIAGEIDIGFVRYPFRQTERFDQIKLLKEPWQALMSEEHPLAHANTKMVGIKLLQRQNLIMPSRESLYLPLVQALTVDKKTPAILCYYFELANAALLARQNEGIAIVPASINHIIKNESYIIKDIQGLKLETGYMAIKLKGDFRTETLREFWGIIQHHKFML